MPEYGFQGIHISASFKKIKPEAASQILTPPALHLGGLPLELLHRLVNPTLD
jgi:hypothetical protein